MSPAKLFMFKGLHVVIGKNFERVKDMFLSKHLNSCFL